MATPRELDIRSRIAAVLAGNLTLRDFYRWFTPATWDISLADDEEAVRLTHHMTHLFNELSAGDLTLQEMKRELQRAMSTYVATRTPWNRPLATVVTTSSMNDLTEDLAPAFVLEAPRVAARAS